VVDVSDDTEVADEKIRHGLFALSE